MPDFFKQSDYCRNIAFVLMLLLPLLIAGGRASADIGVSTVAVLLLVHSVTKGNWSWSRLPDVRLLLFWWMYLILSSALISPEPMASLKIALPWGRFVLFYAAFRIWIGTDRRALTLVSSAAFVSVMLIAVDVYWQYFTGTSLTGRPILMVAGPRLTGALSNANIGNTILKLLVPAFCWVLYESISRRKHLYTAAILIGAAACVQLIPLTGERSVTLLLLAALAAAGILLFALAPAYRRAVIAGALIVGITLYIASTQPVVMQRSSQLAQQVGSFWDSPYGQLFQAAAYLGMEKPLFGIGIGQFWHDCQPYLTSGKLHYCDIHAHNIYLHMFAETGLIGLGFLVAFALLCTVAWWRCVRGGNAVLVAFSGAGLVVVLFPVIVTQNMFSNWPGALFWFSIALTMSILSVTRSAMQADTKTFLPPAKRIPVSAFIITLNEADRIGKVISAIRDTVDEIVVIDSGSTDDTQKVAADAGARVFFNPWPGYGQQKRFAEKQCKNDWLLNLDADEVPRPELMNEIAGLFEQAKTPPHQGYAFRIRAVLPTADAPSIFGHQVAPVRLYDRRAGSYSESTVHDRVEMKSGTTGVLKGDVWHYSSRSIAHSIEKLNRYSSMQAIDIRKRKGTPPLLGLQIVLIFPLAFLKCYLLRRYIFEGLPGFVNSVVYAFSRFARLSKTAEKE